MRRFVFVAHNVPSNGEWSLDDLPGSGGRVDVVVRNLQAAIHLSHGIRADVDCYVVLSAGRVIRIEGGRIQRLNPDERSTAARLQQALKETGSGPSWKEVQKGLWVADLSLQDLLVELPGNHILLDPEGEKLQSESFDNPTFFLSDHLPFTQDEYRLLSSARRVSIGTPWYHGNHVVAVVNHHLDAARVSEVR